MSRQELLTVAVGSTPTSIKLSGSLMSTKAVWEETPTKAYYCLLYTSDAADEGLGVDLGGRRIIK